MYATTNNVTPSRKDPTFTKLGTKPHYEGSEATKTDNYRGDK